MSGIDLHQRQIGLGVMADDLGLVLLAVGQGDGNGIRPSFTRTYPKKSFFEMGEYQSSRIWGKTFAVAGG